MKRIEAVIFDWAGTTVDYGCMAPLKAMQDAFKEHGVAASLEEIRKPMGMAKLDHIKAVLTAKNDMTSVKKIYETFEKNIIQNLHAYTDIIAGVLDVQNYLRENKIKIGSTTGYTQTMIDIVADAAAAQGYTPDCIFCPDQVTRGRPYPYMLQKNLAELDVEDVRCVVKVGDTLVDILEGLNAGCYAVGVVQGSSMLGLNAEEVERLSDSELAMRSQDVKAQMQKRGAHFVIDKISDLPHVINTIQAGHLCAQKI